MIKVGDLEMGRSSWITRVSQSYLVTPLKWEKRPKVSQRETAMEEEAEESHSVRGLEPQRREVQPRNVGDSPTVERTLSGQAARKRDHSPTATRNFVLPSARVTKGTGPP